MTTVSYTALLDIGLRPQQIARWTSDGYLRAEQPHPGTGRPRSWPVGELVIAELMLRYVAEGLTPELAHRAARHDGWLSDRLRVVLLALPEAVAA